MIPTEQTDLDVHFMRLALEQAAYAFEEDEVPIGAVIVHKGKVIAKAYNQCEKLKDPTAHAEMIAITMAAEALEAGRLIGTTIYSTIEPCFMCAGALLHARAERIVFGAHDVKFGACGSIQNIVQDPRLNHRVQLSPGVMEQDCREIMQKFFRIKRATGQN